MKTKAKQKQTLKALEWKKWRDWERALVAWEEHNHDGITLRGLAELTGRRPGIIAAEIKSRQTAGGCVCHAIDAPVFMIRHNEVMDWMRSQPATGMIKWGHTKFFVGNGYSISQPRRFWAQVKKHPGPDHWDVSPEFLSKMKAIARGEKTPWVCRPIGDQEEDME